MGGSGLAASAGVRRRGETDTAHAAGMAARMPARMGEAMGGLGLDGGQDGRGMGRGERGPQRCRCRGWLGGCGWLCVRAGACRAGPTRRCLRRVCGGGGGAQVRTCGGGGVGALPVRP